jgi:hypothetical protein
MANVVLVYRGPNDVKWVTHGGADYIFDKDVHQEVPETLAKALIGNNPEPWQGGWCDVYEVVKPTGGDG